MTRPVPQANGRLAVLATVATLAAALSAGAQTRIELHDNSYTPEQDVKLGRQAAAEVRQQMPVLEDDRPDLIAFDMTVYAAGRILARKWGVPGAQLFPSFASNEHYSHLDRMLEKMPDKGSLRHPALRAFFGELTRVLAAHGQSDRSVEDIMGQVDDLNLVFIPRSFHPADATVTHSRSSSSSRTYRVPVPFGASSHLCGLVA